MGMCLIFALTAFRGVPEGVCLAGSMEEAIAILQSDLMKPKLGDVFVIGGHSIYKVGAS